MTDLKPLSHEQRDKLAVLDTEDQEVQEGLVRCDYEVWKVRIADDIFTVYHGFPGDNPLGVFVSPDGWIQFGECREPDSTNQAFTVFYAWYMAQSEQMCNYSFLAPLP